MGKSHKSEKSNKSEKSHKSKKKHKDRNEKTKSKKIKKHLKDEKKGSSNPPACGPDEDFSIPLDLMNNKSHAPETPEEYQKRQSRLRKEIDPVTGRMRLIKGDGEVLEEIVSRDRHKAINKEATQGDGTFFQNNTIGRQI